MGCVDTTVCVDTNLKQADSMQYADAMMCVNTGLSQADTTMCVDTMGCVNTLACVAAGNRGAGGTAGVGCGGTGDT